MRLSNVDLVSYKKLQRHFLAAGVVINSEIKQQDWLLTFTKLLDITPITQLKLATVSHVTSDIVTVVAELLEYSSDPLCGTDVICFNPLLAKLQSKLPKILKADQIYLLSKTLSKLGFSKLARIRIRGEQQSVWIKRIDGADPTINWAKDIIESRFINN